MKENAADGKDIKSFFLEELQQEMTRHNEKPYRGKQLYEWMHQKLARSFDEMTNIPAKLREECEKQYKYISLHTIKVQESLSDGTKKYLFELGDGNLIESVWMKYKHGNSVCISSQVGCRMGCRFCASALNGFQRNLTPSEMLDQVYAITLHTGERVSNVVVMGCGEPLDNYDNLLRFLRLLTDENGLHVSQRSVTVSTCGLVPEIYRLAGEKLQITLALSLHGVTDEKRKKIMPVADRYPLCTLMDACRYYFQETGRRITLEYCLVEGINDSEEDARELAGLAKARNYHINLIPMNPVSERNYVSPKEQNILNFKNKLEKNKINVTIRREMGQDIEGACGQLRHRYKHIQERPSGLNDQDRRDETRA